MYGLIMSRLTILFQSFISTNALEQFVDEVRARFHEKVPLQNPDTK